jgi:hypothetical protein
MEPMDIRGYKFEDEAQAEEARKAIIVRIGPIVERETMGGKATNSFLF